MPLPEFQWSGVAWRRGIPGVLPHQDDREFWHDDGASFVDDVGLHLLTRKNPRTFGGKLVANGAGVVSSKEAYRYGRFEIDALLPDGKHLWPAFWLVAMNTWPPEVDAVEAYSNKRGSYFSFRWKTPLAWWAVRTNMHKGPFASRSQLGQRQHVRPWGNPAWKTRRYAVEWTPDAVRIFHGSHLVRENRDSEFLRQCAEARMYAVLNNAATERDASESDFLVRAFRYEPCA
jgi:hypothetical protein